MRSPGDSGRAAAARARRRGRTWPAASGPRRATQPGRVAERVEQRSRRRRTRRGPGRARPPRRRGRATARPTTSGSRPSSAPSSVVLPEPLGPTMASRSPQPISRSTGPSRNAPRSTTAPASRATTSPLRGAAASSSRSSQPSHGLSTDVEPLERLLGGLHLGRLLLRRRDLEVAMNLSFSVASFFACRTPCTDHCALRAARCSQPALLGAVRRRTPPRRGGARSRRCLEVAEPPAAELGAPARVLVELEHPGDGAVEEGAVVGHDDDAAGSSSRNALEPVEPGEVEVVGRLVEEEHVEAAEQDRGQRGARRLPTGERARSHVEQVAPGGPGRRTRPAPARRGRARPAPR